MLLFLSLIAVLAAGCGGTVAASTAKPAREATGPAIPLDSQLDPKPLALQAGDLGDIKWQLAKGSRYLSEKLLVAQDPAWAEFLGRHGRQLVFRRIFERPSRIAQCVLTVLGSPADARAVEAELIPFTLASKSANQLGTVQLVDDLGPAGGHAALYASRGALSERHESAIASWRRGVLVTSCVEAMKTDAKASIERATAIAAKQDARIVSTLTSG